MHSFAARQSVPTGRRCGVHRPSATGLTRTARVDGDVGNQARLRRLHAAPAGLQAKLSIGSTSDPLEHEADAAADQVMRMAGPVADASAGLSAAVPRLSRKCSACEDEDKGDQLMRKAAPGAALGGEAPGVVHDVLSGAGRPLDAGARTFMEGRFSHDFSGVRIHTGPAAERSAQAVGAQAYTVGSQIVFGRGSFAPASAGGRHLLAHELAHVVQQGGGSATLRRAPAVGPDSPDYQQGYGDGVAGEPSRAIPRGGDALINYDEGYSKGQYEFNQAKAAPPAPADPAKPAPKPASGGVCSSSDTAGAVTLCNRDFAGKIAGAIVPARHCFVWAHPAGTTQTSKSIDPTETSTYDPSTGGTADAEPNKAGTECLQTYDVDPDCVRKKYNELCDPKDFNLGSNNCCSCANAALTACGAKPVAADFPKKNQGAGLPDSFGTGWKKSVLEGGNWILHNVLEQI